MDRPTLLRRLSMAKEDTELTKLRFFHLDFDDVLAQAVVELMIHDTRSTPTRQWQKLFLGACQGRGLLLVCETAVTLIPKLELWGGSSRLRHAALYASIATSLGTARSRLQSLSLKRVWLDGASADALGQGLQLTQTLQELDLRHSCFGDRPDSPAIHAMCTGLRQNTTLRTLNMGNCELDDDDVLHLAQALRGHACLQEWLLECNSCGHAGLRAIATLLQDNRLVKLDLSHQVRHAHEWGPDLCGLLQALMQPNTSIQILDLSGNSLEDRHFQVLAEMLTINTTLKHLYLYRRLEQVRQYPHTQQGVVALISALRLHNQTLETLAIPSKDDDSLQDLVRELLVLTNFNKAGRRLLNYHQPNTNTNTNTETNTNNIPLGLWPLVLARINTLNWTYRNPYSDGGDPGTPLLHYILRQGPMENGAFYGGR